MMARILNIVSGSAPGFAAVFLFCFFWFSGTLDHTPIMLAVGIILSLLGLSPLLSRIFRGELAALVDAGWRDRVAAAIFETAADGQFVFNEHGIVACNDAVLVMLGATHRNQVEGRHPAVFSPEFQNDGSPSGDKAREAIGIAIKNGVHRFEWTHCRLDGSHFDVLVTLVATIVRGRPLITSYWQDISDRVKAREAEKEERRTAEAQHRREEAMGQEIIQLVDSVAAGDLSYRLDLADKEGFYRTVSEGINRLTDTVEGAVADIAQVMSALAEGDLSRRISKSYQGAFNELKNDVNATSAKLAEMVGKINEASETISEASNEVSLGSADLAERTEQQASSLEETAASMEQLGATVRSNAETAQRANTMAGDARKAAEQGGVVAGSAIDAMKDIAEASRKITDIIGVIDEIAFQTNLLALNAAVEAARAGDAGKGFAVVAQEVRLLAQRSAQASKEIKALITNSDAQVQHGVDLVKKAGVSLDGIAAGVQQVAALISEIAGASTEQTNALEEINAAVAGMDEITQKNAALVEETAAAAQSMFNQTADLKELMGFFATKARR
jgi:PAS domain S-box-containing protein